MSIATNYKSGKYSMNTHSTHARFRGGASIDENLGDSDYVKSLTRYVSKKLRSRLLDKSYAQKEGLNLIGSKGDTGNVFGTERGRLFHSAKSSSKKKAGEILWKEAVKEQLRDTMYLKGGRKVNVKFLGKGSYIKEVKYMSRGKEISYTQARNYKTGRIISLKKLLKTTKF